jgi:hypothetical protein
MAEVTDKPLTRRRARRDHPWVTMLLTHAFSNRLWQRACALPAMTFVIVKRARESVSDR